MALASLRKTQVEPSRAVLIDRGEHSDNDHKNGLKKQRTQLKLSPAEPWRHEGLPSGAS